MSKFLDNQNNTGKVHFISEMTKAELIDFFAGVVKEAMEQRELNMSSTLDQNELLTREEAAQEFKVSVATIDNYKRYGYIIPRRLGGTVRYKRSDLQAAFSGNIINPYKGVDRRKG